jgi:uncharacterized protein YciI
MTRKFALCGFLLWMAVGILPMSLAQTQASSAPRAKNCVGKANKAKISAYVMLLRLRWDLYAKWKETGKWPDDSEANKALEGHSEYWTKNLKEGRAIVAGAMNGDYWDNAAMIVFEAASLEEAQTMANNDPAVKAHAFQAQVRPFDVFWVTNKFQEGMAVCAEQSNNSGQEIIPRAEADEQEALRSVRTLNTALAMYNAAEPAKGYAASLKDLGPEGKAYIEKTLASGTKSGYTFDYKPEPATAGSVIMHYTLVARPVKQLAPGEKSFFTDESGLIRFTKEDRPATVSDPPIG